MRFWIRSLAALACMALALCLPGVAALAEGQASSSSLELRIQNQEQALGEAVDASRKASDITRKCKIRTSEDDRDRLTDSHVNTGCRFDGKTGWITVEMPSGTRPGAVRIEWLYDPTGYELIEYGADEAELRTRTLSDTFPGIYTMFALLPETRFLRLKLTGGDQVVVNLAVYSEGVLPYDVQTWLPPVEKADMMVLSTHQDDEVVFLGGTIPYSDVVCKRPTVTVYMANCGRERRREALECLWAMGSRNYPEFINLEDDKVGSIEKGIALWGGRDNILKLLVERIRRYKPEVIVTQDFDGEYGHNQHKIVARATPYAVQAAADPTQYPESYAQYGAWQVKKLYIHLYQDNEIHMDWHAAQPALGGMSLLKVAQLGMEKHASQTKYYKVKDQSQYDNSRFGLYMTTVGADVVKDDFFENIDADASARYLAEQAAAAREIPAQPEGESGEIAETLEEAPADGETGSAAEQDAEILNVEGTSGASGDPTAAPPAEAPSQPRTGTGDSGERRSGIGPIAMVCAGVAAAVGAGAWALSRRSGGRRRKKRRQAGVYARRTAKGTAKAPTGNTTKGRHAAKR